MKNKKDVYIYQSFRKTDGKSSSRIYKKLGKYNALLEQFDGDADKLMAWAKNEADTLRSMKLTLLNTANGYVPSYTRTEITDLLHKTFGFRTDYEFIKKSTMIVSSSRPRKTIHQKLNHSTYRLRSQKTATHLFYCSCSRFSFPNCQRWDYIC